MMTQLFIAVDLTQKNKYNVKFSPSLEHNRLKLIL